MVVYIGKRICNILKGIDSSDGGLYVVTVDKGKIFSMVRCVGKFGKNLMRYTLFGISLMGSKPFRV